MGLPNSTPFPAPPRDLPGSWKAIALVVLVLALIFCYRGLADLDEPGGDLRNHREWGRRFLAGEPLYAGGLNIPYPPFWALVHAPPALLPGKIAFQVQLALAGLSLVVLFAILHGLNRNTASFGWLSSAGLFAAVLVALSRFVLRDLQDGGANLILLAIVWSAIRCWTCGRDGLGGGLLGLAVALKCTPVLTLGYFAWKRQWRFVAVATTTATTLSLSPALWQDWDPFREQALIWAGNIRAGLTEPDPTRGVLGPEEVRNLALRPTLGRLAGFVAPVFPPELRGWVVKGSLLLLAVGCFRLWRGPVHTRCHPSVLWQCAGVGILTLLISPITWGPHCVALIPAVFLLSRELVGGRIRGWLTVGFSALCMLACRSPVNPALVGATTSDALARAGLTTWALVTLLALCLARAGRGPTEPRARPSPQGSPGCTSRLSRSGRPGVCAAGGPG